jgi:hypothetical protein
MPKKAAETETKRERVVVQLDADQVQQLVEEADRRRKASGARRLNLSELVREALAAWLAKVRR